MARASVNTERDPAYGVLQDFVDALFRDAPPAELSGDASSEEIEAWVAALDKPYTRRRLDILTYAESIELPEDLLEIVRFLPPGDYTRRRLVDQLNSAIAGRAWGYVYGTVS